MSSASIFICENIGVSGITPCHIQQNEHGVFEARMGVAVMGMTNMDGKGLRACNHNPFHNEFYENFARGFGGTQEDAIEALKEDMKSITNTLWME
jgi:hypothetical protein